MVNVKIPVSLHHKLKATARQEGRFLEYIIERILEQGIESRKPAR